MRTSTALALPLLVTASMCASASAQIIWDSNGFEQPAYEVGDLSGQEGWTTLGIPSLTRGHRVVAGSGPSGGSQVVEAWHDGNSGNGISQSVDYVFDAAGTFQFSSDFRLDSSWFDRDSGSTYESGISVGLGTDSQRFTWSLLATKTDAFEGWSLTDGTTDDILASTLDTDWHNLMITYDNATGMMSGFVDGNFVSSMSFSPESFSKLYSVELFSNRQSTTHPGSAYYDTAVAAVPEPSTMAALGLGLACLLRRRKK